MSTTTADVDTYAARVRAALADLPATDREALIADLEDHLAEVAAEGELADLLGSPEAYAAELRSSAGLPPARAPEAGATPRPRPEWLTATLDFLPELRPAWWVLRGLALGGLVAAVVGSPAVGVLCALLAVPASVLLGRRAATDDGKRWLAIGLNVVAGLVLVLFLALVGGSGGGGPAVESTDPGPAGRLTGVTNLHPYSSDGKPLKDVQLFDQNGDPVELVAEYDDEGRPLTRIPRRTADGRVTDNVYPQEQNTGEGFGAGGPGRPDRPVLPPTVRAPSLLPR